MSKGTTGPAIAPALQTSAVAQPVDHRPKLVATHHVYHGIDGRDLRDVLPPNRHLRHTESRHELAFGGARVGDHLAATVDQQLHRRHAHSPGRSGHKHPLASDTLGPVDHASAVP
nr:hypothetical protein [Candidatus Microthrix sp.]